MKLGVYQCDAVGRDQAARIAALEEAVAGQQIDLLICPELFASGYNLGAELAALAEPPDGPFAQAIGAFARRQKCAVVYGYPEAAEGRVYNSAALLDAEGQLLATHRKRVAAPGGFEEEVFAEGKAVTFADLSGWRIAMLICYEVEFPESLRQAAKGGAELVVVPTALGADWGIVAEKVVPVRAFENGLWLAYADHAGEERGRRYFGGSRIVGPDGAARAVVGPREGLATARIDKESIACARSRIPYLRDCTRL